MKKTLFLILALCTLSTASWGAVTTVTYVVGDTATKYSWANLSTHPDLQMDAQISVNATHDPNSSNTNGTYSSNQWYAYKADNSGEFSINASAGYWIQSIAVNNNPQKGGTLVKKGTETQIPSDETPVAVNAQSITFNVINGTSGNICARILRFIVTYDVAPTGISLNVPAAMNATVGNKFQIIATVAPSTTVFQAVKWTTNNASAVDVDQNGIIDVKGAGKATITATTVNGKTATCVIDAAATTDESFVEEYAKLTEQATLKSSYTQFEGTYGQLWRVRNFIHSSATELSSGISGVAIQGGATNFIAFASANVEGGVKRVAFQWRAVDATKPVNFDVDDPADAANTKLSTRLAANSDYANVQSFSRDVNRDKNYQFRITVADAASSNIVYGPLTITPYLLYKTKVAEATGTYKNEDLINNTGATPTFTLEDNDGEASIADDGTVTCLKEGEVTIKASWNGGQVYTTYTLTTHVKPIPDITFGNTIIDAFGSYTPAPVAKLSDLTIEDAQWTYTSSNAAVATVNEGVFTITGAGTSTITATLVAGETYASTSATATLTVNEPTVGVWIETFDSLEATTGYNEAKEVHPFDGRNHVYNWQVRNYQFTKADGDKVNGKNGIRIKYSSDNNNYIATAEPYEGGVQALYFNWRLPGSGTVTTDYTVSISGGNMPYSNTVQKSVKAGTGQYYTFVETLNNKSNGMLRFKVNKDAPSTIFSPVTIKPYLLYTRKDTSIKAMDYETAAFKYTNKDTIDNTNGEGVISYAIEDAANKADIATIDAATGEVTIVGDGTVKVIAKWKHDPVNSPLDSVTTSYNLTILLRKHGVKFEHKDTTVYLKDGGSYTQEVTKACASAVPVYSFEGEYGTCQINSETGEVTFTEPDTVVVKATVPQVLPYKGGSATYTLRINRSDIDPATLSFQIAENPVEKNMNDEPFSNVLTVPDGAGTVTYTSDKPKVATVDLNSGLVTIIGGGTATITANVADGTLYNKTSKAYTLEVSEPEGEKSYTETFKAYQSEGWTTASTDVTTKEGDYFKWDVYKARHDKDRDTLFNKSRATWLNSQGYIRTTDTLQGGIKRISFKWNKVNEGSVRALFSLFWTEDNSGYDQVDVNPVETGETETLHNPDLDYSHNFFLKRNVPLRIVNSKNNAVLVLGEITITPYIYFPKRCDTIIATEYIGKKAYAPLVTMDNTNSDGTITYDSDNKEVAEVNNNGIVTIKAASATPVKITMIWQPSDQVETVTASYLLLVSDKQDRQAEFAENDVTVARGEVVTNNLTIHTVSGDVPATPTYTLESADTCVAKVIDGEVHAIAPGNTVITAHIDATSKCKALDVSYTLHVNYTPTGQYWFETLKNIQGGAGDKATTEAVNGEDGIANKWKVTNVFHKDQINGKTGTRVRYSSSIATNEGVTLEGGIKEVLFSWRVFNNSFPTHFTVTAGSKPYEYRHGILASADDVQPFAHDFNVKSNVALSISIAEQEDPQQSHIIIDSIKVIPYLYYTRKDTTLVANEMGGVYTYSNNKLINNTEDAVADNFSYTVRAKDHAVSIADSHSDQLTIIGAGTDTIQAAWDGVTTTYVVHVVLEDAALDFAEKTPVVLLGTGSYTQTASKSTTADVTYEFEGEHGTATINETTGEVIFNGQTGEFHILASVPVALPYNLDSARYVLTVNNKPTPTVVFDPKTVDMNAAAFTPEAKTIPSSGMGTASYESSNEEVAKIEEGKVTIVGEGTSTISVHYEEGDEWGEADADFLLTVEDPNEDAITENFANDADWQKACTTEIDIDGLFGWKTYLTRHRSSGDSKDVLASGEQATWFNNSGNAYLKSANAIEGGIKRVAFNWKKETATAPSFTVKVDNEPIVVDATDRTGIDQRFNHNYFVKKNVALEIDNNTASLLRVGAIKITPYLYYETKKCTLDLKVKDNFKNEDLIDNRDDKAASSISYSIIAGNEGSIAEIAADGTVTATAGGEITVQAQWSSNTSVTTTYTLTILPSKTTINLMRNDGTEDKDVIENNIGEVMPEFTLPTRDNYRFNAYFIDQECTVKRFTVTTLTYTGWVSNLKYNSVTYTGDDRIWTYSGNDAVTLYADWKAERTITLDNQEATTAGTEEVVTAYCPNNNTVNLMDPIEVPQKDNNIFLGYFTEEEGAGTQLIDANGAFIANVTGYTDTEKNYRKWIKDEDITLYAAWKEAVVLDENNTALAGVIEENHGETVSVLLKRNLKSAYYNTICLPFALDADQVTAAFGDGTKIAEMVSTQGVASDPEAIDIMFEFRSAMAAGIPYLIKTGHDVEQVVIDGVTIYKDFTNPTKGIATMTCVVSKTTEMMVSGKYFLAKNDILAYYTDEAITSVAQTVLGMRAYFTFSSAAAPKRARCVFGHGVTTDVENVPGETKVDEPQKVFINGNLYIIREGKTYDAQGRLVK